MLARPLLPAPWYWNISRAPLSVWGQLAFSPLCSPCSRSFAGAPCIPRCCFRHSFFVPNSVNQIVVWPCDGGPWEYFRLGGTGLVSTKQSIAWKVAVFIRRLLSKRSTTTISSGYVMREVGEVLSLSLPCPYCWSQTKGNVLFLQVITLLSCKTAIISSWYWVTLASRSFMKNYSCFVRAKHFIIQNQGSFSRKVAPSVCRAV